MGEWKAPATMMIPPYTSRGFKGRRSMSMVNWLQVTRGMSG